jgi:long-chain acyl-CoA synthetase
VKPMNFANYVEFQAAERPGELAMTDPKREMSYAELDAETSAVANALADRGVEPGDNVALFLPNLTTFTTAYFGAMKLGAVPVPINLRFGESEIGHVILDVDPEVLFTIGQFEEAFVEHDLDLELVVAGGEHGTDYGEMVADAQKSFETEPQLDTDVAEILYTSGTTGMPKGVEHTHGNLAANARAGRAHMEYGSDTVFLTVAPCFHASGLNATTTPAVVHGAENYFLPKWDPETALQTMAAKGVTYTMLIPTMVIDLLEHGTEGYDLSAFESLLVGGSPMPKERIADAEAALGCDLYEGYGMTETTLGAAANTPGQDVYKAGSIGPVAGEMAEVRIEDPDTREEVGAGERGELLWHGDTITPGYYAMPEKNEEVFVEREGKTWLRSGDIGHVDEDGHLFVDDRVDDMVISGGENVYPREVEDVIYELEEVVEAAVIGTPHERLGEQVTAVVRGDVTAAEVEAVCRDRLADYKVPREVHFADELPKTSTRKIDKVTLREQFE